MKEKILSFIDRYEEDEETWNELMLEVFRAQFQENDAYRAYCQEKRKTLRTVRHWRDIPFVPVDAFKHLTLSRVPIEETAACFMTSGSTSGLRGKHYQADLDIYDASMDATIRRFVLKDIETIHIANLFPTREMMPNSSLAHYLNYIVETFGHNDGRYFIDDQGIDFSAFEQFLNERIERKEPVLLLGATYNYVHLFEHFKEQTWLLPEGSIIFDTGGYKNQSTELPVAEFYERLSSMFHVPKSRCVNMYGMSELSSQYYDTGNEVTPSIKYGPPWLKTRIIDPLTEKDVPKGEKGIIVHYDLCNVNSVVAVMTEDAGYATDDGFVLLGRAEGAEAKGCSLQLEDFLAIIGDHQ